MPKPSVCSKTEFQQPFPTTMPAIVPLDFAGLEDETRKLQRKAATLHRQYLLALVATVVASAALITLWSLPLLGPLFGDAYIFGSPSV